MIIFLRSLNSLIIKKGSAMKVGILTMRSKKNYGGTLQCYALQNAVIDMGHETNIIRFSLTQKNSFFRKLLILADSFDDFSQYISLIKDSYLKKFSQKNQKNLSQAFLDAFARFNDSELNYTELVDENNIYKVANQFDAIVVGSDQIWTGLTKKQLTYLLDWTPEFNGIRISYSACSSDAKIPFITRNKAAELFKKFHFLSVRDQNTFDLVKKTCGRVAEITVDPTFLHGFEELYASDDEPAEPYVFVYIIGIGIRGGHEKVIERIKKRYGAIKIIAVAISDQSLEAELFADEVIHDASPQQWVHLIKGASFVYTDSFHGCVFAMKFQIEFLGYYSYAHRATRLLDLKQRYGVGRNIVSSINEVIKNDAILTPIDYPKVNVLIENEINKSFTYLRNCLKGDRV